ncbi:MAG: alpha/beta hydrolase [Candidatus Bathyarchaeota archaeon]|nr:alpha/beta hydrolase [Candidatus Bathyarchaeota archaeon]
MERHEEARVNLPKEKKPRSDVCMQLNPKFYKEISPEFRTKLTSYRENHPIKKIKFNNKEIEYISCGSGEKTVLTFHGALGNAEGNFQAINFFEKKYRVIAPSITNFETLDELSEGVNEVLKSENVEEYILIGQSFGSFMAQPYFHRNFKKIKALILVNSYPPNNEWVDDFKKAMKIIKLIPAFILRKLMSRELMKLVEENMEMPPKIREELKFLKAFIRERLSSVEKSVIICQSRLTGEFNSEKYRMEDYLGWDGKVMIFTANDDKGFPYHEKLKRQYPNVEEIIFENVGHMGTLLKRDEYHAILNRFLTSLN